MAGSKIREVAISSFKETGDEGVVNSGEIGSRDVLVTVVLRHGCMTPLCALSVWKSEMKTQRVLCLEALVGLAPHEEELGQNERVVVNSLLMHSLANPVGEGGLTMIASSGCTSIADKNLVTFSSKSPRSPAPSPKIRCVRLVSTGCGTDSTFPVTS